MGEKHAIHSETTILAALAAQRFNDAKGYALLPQVRNTTGYGGVRDNAVRTADAIAVQLWPSRGITLTGIEIKANRADWRRELESPKAESIARFCHYWYVAAPQGLVEFPDLPVGWGLLEVSDKGKVRSRVTAPLQTADPPNLPFVASIMRTLARKIELPQDALRAAERVGYQQGHAAAIRDSDAKRERDEAMRASVEAFAAATGINLASHSWEKPEDSARRAQDLAQGVRSLRRLTNTDAALRGYRDAVRRLLSIANDLSGDLDTIEQAASHAAALLDQHWKVEP